MLGIIPAAGSARRIQPLAFSKELLPVGSRMDGHDERPRAVSEYIVERMLRAGVDHFCFVISPGKSDILEYYGGGIADASVAYVVQPQSIGLCDAVFRALPWARPEQPVLIGLPDTIWFPVDAAQHLSDDQLSFLLFPVQHPELFDVVLTDAQGQVCEIKVKQPGDGPAWIWGAIKMPGRILHELFVLWCARARRDEYLGTLINAYLAQGGLACAVAAGRVYMDVGTVHGYREAMRELAGANVSAEDPQVLRRAAR